MGYLRSNKEFRKSLYRKRSLHRQRLDSEAKALAAGEPRANWPLYSRRHLVARRSDLRKRISIFLKNEPAPLKPTAPEGVDCRSDVVRGGNGFPVEVPSQDLKAVWKKYKQDLKEWEVKDADWHARRTPEYLESMVQEGINNWHVNTRAKNGKKGSIPAPANFVELSQDQDLGGSWASIKVRITTLRGRRKEVDL